MTWAEHEVPILEAVREAEESGSPPFEIDSNVISEQAGLDHDVTCQALGRLARAGYIELVDTSTFGRTSYHSIALAERGLRTVGVWPPEDAYDSLRTLLEQAIAEEKDPGKRSQLKSLLSSLIGMGKDATGALLSAWLKDQAGL